MASVTEKMWCLKKMERGEKELNQKKDNQESTASKDKEKKRGRKCKMLPPPPAQEVDVPLLVGGVSCSPLTGINANDSSVRLSQANHPTLCLSGVHT
jgi:hypothetical protein